MSRPCWSTSASVHMPGGIKVPGSYFPKFCQEIASAASNLGLKDRYLMPITKLHRSRVRTAFLACRRVGEVTTPCIDDFTLLLLGNLDRDPAITQKKGYNKNVYPCPIRTSGCMHRFFRLVKPRPMKFSSLSLCSGVSAHDIRYSTSLFNSERAFSISGTVREQYISLRFAG